MQRRLTISLLILGVLCAAAPSTAANDPRVSYGESVVRIGAGAGGVAELIVPGGLFLDSERGWLVICEENAVIVATTAGAERHRFTADKPIDVVLNESGVFYVIERLKGDVTVLRQRDMRGRLDAEIGFPESPRKPSPVSVALGPDDSLYVADAANNRIWVFDKDAELMDWWQVQNVNDRRAHDGISGVAVSDDGRCAVSLGWQADVQIYTLQGDLVLTFAGTGQQPGRMIHIKSVTFGPEGLIYVVGGRRSVVNIFNADGSLFTEVRGVVRRGIFEFFYMPDDIEVGTDGTIFVSVRGTRRVEGWTVASTDKQ